MGIDAGSTVTSFGTTRWIALLSAIALATSAMASDAGSVATLDRRSNMPSNAINQADSTRGAQSDVAGWVPSRPYCELGLQLIEYGVHPRIVRSVGPAQQAGIRAGDWLIAVNGIGIASPTDLDTRSYAPGTTLPVSVYSEGRGVHTINVVCADGLPAAHALEDLFETLHRGITTTGFGASSTHFAGRRYIARCVEVAQDMLASPFYLDFQTVPLLSTCLLGSPDDFDAAAWDATAAITRQLDGDARALFDATPGCEFGEYNAFLSAYVTQLSQLPAPSGRSAEAARLSNSLDPRWRDANYTGGADCRATFPGTAPAGQAVARFQGPLAPLQQRAASGDARAMVELGWKYWDGDGVPQDRAAGLRWWRQASAAGDAEAQQLVADIDRQLGNDPAPPARPAPTMAPTPQPAPLPSAPLARSAPAQPSASPASMSTDELMRLADGYRRGVGKPRNYVAAYALYSVIAAQGVEAAADRMDELEGIMSPAAIQEAQDLASALWSGDWRGLP